MNETLFHLINDQTGRWLWLDLFGVFCSQYLWIFMTLALIILAGWNHKKWRELVFVAIASAAIARGVFVTIIKWLYDHPRPDVVIRVQELVKGDTVNSFPSGHTTFVFALAMGVYLYNRNLGRWYFALAVLASVARVFVGVHWPFDILAGAILGVGVAHFGDKAYRRFLKNKKG